MKKLLALAIVIITASVAFTQDYIGTRPPDSYGTPTYSTESRTSGSSIITGGTIAVGSRPSISGNDADSGIDLGGDGFGAKSIVTVLDGVGQWEFVGPIIQSYVSGAIIRQGAGGGTLRQDAPGGVQISTSTTGGTTSLHVRSDGLVQPPQMAKAQINGISPVATGAIVVCSDCTRPFTLCISTGTGVNQFREQGQTTGCF